MAGERSPSDDEEDVAERSDPADGGEHPPAVDPGDHTVAELEEALEDVEDADALRTILEAEEAGKDRKTGKAAIERRIDAVESEAAAAEGALAPAGGGETAEEADAAAHDDGTTDAAEADDELSEVTPADADEDAVSDADDETDTEDGDEEPPEDDDSSTADDVLSAFGGGLSGPEEDREMPLTAHIEEMVRRLAVVVAVAGLVTLFVFPFTEDIINYLWYSILPGVEEDIARPRLYGVLELIFTKLKVASLAGLIIGLPVLVYETYAFMRPGLYPHERRYYLAAIPTSMVLALVGVSFAYFVILPAIFVYFLYYSQDVATIGFALGRTFDLILLLMGYMAIVFQIPLFIMLAMMMGLTSRAWLADKRILFWGAFLGISFLFSPDPTGMAPIVVGTTMIVLFEGTLLLAKWTGRE